MRSVNNVTSVTSFCHVMSLVVKCSMAILVVCILYSVHGVERVNIVGTLEWSCVKLSEQSSWWHQACANTLRMKYVLFVN